MVEYACFGLAGTTGKEAARLTWIRDDVPTDLDRITATLGTCSGTDHD